MNDNTKQTLSEIGQTALYLGKRIIGPIAVVASLPIALYLLGPTDMKPDKVKRSDEVFENGIQKVLDLHISNDGISTGRDIRFYDTNGDGKTVEQYVELYCQNAGLPLSSNVSINLIRKGSTPVFGKGVYTPKIMTTEQMARLDSVYQKVLFHQKNGYLIE